MIKVLRCSSLSRVMQCNGSQFFTNLPSQPTNPAAEEGTAAAEMLECILKRLQTGTHAKNGVRFNEDIQFNIPHVASDILKNAAGSVASEQSIDWKTRSGIWIKGTYDAAYVDNFGQLNIDDLKFGYGIVEPENNWQLIAYAIGEVIRRGQVFEKIILRIRQPRPHHEKGPDRAWVISYAELLAFKEQIEAKCDTLAAGDATLTTGTSCKYCPAAAVCGAANRSFYLGVEVAMSHVQDNIDDAAIARELDVVQRAVEMIKLREDSLKALAIDRIKRGKLIPGYVTEETYGDRKWKANVSPDVIKLMTGKDIIETMMLSPAKAEKLGVNKAVVKELVDRHYLGYKLKKKDTGKLGDEIFGKTKPQEMVK